jgi:hypothetical protein
MIPTIVLRSGLAYWPIVQRTLLVGHPPEDIQVCMIVLGVS